MPKEKKSYIITYVRAFKVQKENWLLPIKKKKIGWGGQVIRTPLGITA